jgi:hypothetical protein
MKAVSEHPILVDFIAKASAESPLIAAEKKAEEEKKGIVS